MSEELPTPPTSPNLKADDGIVRNAVEFSNALTLDLNDDEIKVAFRTIAEVTNKYHNKWIAMFRTTSDITLDRVEQEINEFRDELVTKLAERVQIVATVDGGPVVHGQPPVVEILGRLPGTNFDKYGMDHEKKEWEVKRATQRDEAFLGQKRNTRKKES